MCEKEMLCGKPHEYSDSWRCIIPVDERGVHVASRLGWCLCSSQPKDESEFYFDKSCKRKTVIKGS
jgi:hypothetical protein